MNTMQFESGIFRNLPIQSNIYNNKYAPINRDCADSKLPIPSSSINHSPLKLFNTEMRSQEVSGRLPSPTYICGYNPSLQASNLHAQVAPDALSEISTVEVDDPENNKIFELSTTLQNVLQEKMHGEPCDELKDAEALTSLVSKEALKFATSRKEHVRGALKAKQQDLERKRVLSVRDRSRLRSRREARVSRVRDRAFESALKDAIRWLLSQQGGASNTDSDQSCASCCTSDGNTVSFN